MNTSLRGILVKGVLLSVALLISGCWHHHDDIDDLGVIVGSGKLVSRDVHVASFDGILVTGSAAVVITQDSTEGVRVVADDNIIDRVTVNVAGGTLAIGLQQGSYHNTTVTVYVSMKSIHRLECVGAAEFSVSAPIVTDALACTISGAGQIDLLGTATDQTIVISGAGEVHNFGLTSVHSSVSITGTGNVQVNVTGQLDATISGTGSVVYSGNPPNVHRQISGVGSIGPKG